MNVNANKDQYNRVDDHGSRIRFEIGIATWPSDRGRQVKRTMTTSVDINVGTMVHFEVLNSVHRSLGSQQE